MKARWNTTLIAESPDTKTVENNHYFPRESIKEEFFTASTKSTRCPWKGEASYYSIEVNGMLLEDAAWYYPQASYAAKPIENYVAFGKGIEITE